MTHAAQSSIPSPMTSRYAPRIASMRATWPFASQDEPLPPALPDGSPWPRISVITPSYNQGRYIEETILSVLHQGYPNLEYIVVDGGSTDETLAVVSRYRDRLAHFESEKDRGQSHAINKGFARSTGSILTWLNSDDQFAPGALAAAATAFHTSKADMIAGIAQIYRDGKHTQSHMTCCEDGPLPLDELLDLERGWLAGRFFYQPEVLFTREAWARAGGRVEETLFYSMDYELWLRLAHTKAKLHVIGRPICHFRAHEQQKTASTDGGGYQAELPKVKQAFLERTGHQHTPIKAYPIKPKLKVTMVNDLGYAFGAGIAHRRVAHALLAGGQTVSTIASGRAEPHIEAPAVSPENIVEKLREEKPDLVVVGNLHGTGLGERELSRIASEFKTAFVMHDQWLLTGRCAYTGSCTKYRASEGGCGEHCTCAPSHLKKNPEEIHPTWQRKRDAIAALPDLWMWGNSGWIGEIAKQALPPADAARIRPIRFGLELDVFRPWNKMDTRARLGLPTDKFIIMTSASSLSDERKGLRHLAQAIERLALDDAMVMGVGWFGKNEQPPIPGMKALGYSTSPQQLAQYYAAADLFVGPSLEEAFGQVFIEAAACGTPSIGYPVGGVPEAIEHGVSGLVASRVDPLELSRCIETLYVDTKRRLAMSRLARAWAENEWSLQASYHKLFLAMRGAAMARGWAMPAKIDLACQPLSPPASNLIAPISPPWRAISGFDGWEAANPAKGMPRGRWAHGPMAKLEFDADEETAGNVRLLIVCRCFTPDQRVRLVVNDAPTSDCHLPSTRAKSQESVIAFPVKLKRGVNTIELHCWRWATGPRPLGLLIHAISAIPEGRRVAMGGATGGMVGAADVLTEPKVAVSKT